MKNKKQKAEEHSSLKTKELLQQSMMCNLTVPWLIYICVCKENMFVYTQSGEKNKVHKTNVSKC